MVARSEALASVPEGLSPADAAPLMCAGVTTFNALRNSGARTGDLVAVLGLGGLGHLAVQFVAKGGFRTVAIARGKDKAPLAQELGATVYIDSQTQDVAKELRRLGGARVVLATVTAGDAMAAVMGGLGADGTLLVIGAADSLTVFPGQMIGGRLGVKGWYSGVSIDSQDTLDFCVMTGVRSRNEEFPLDRVNEGYERMMSGRARFRAVLMMG
jgi:D-arabinose 1-dehydrogenase-like Zn-dependent alcohol dehydrogenase